MSIWWIRGIPEPEKFSFAQGPELVASLPGSQFVTCQYSSHRQSGVSPFGINSDQKRTFMICDELFWGWTALCVRVVCLFLVSMVILKTHHLPICLLNILVTSHTQSYHLFWLLTGHVGVSEDISRRSYRFYNQENPHHSWQTNTIISLNIIDGFNPGRLD